METELDDLEKVVTHFEDFLNATEIPRTNSERDRDYIDHKQWTADQIAALEKRGQAAIVVNRIAPKYNFLLGFEERNKTDPRAYPRNPNDNGASEAVTDALRYVIDNTDFQSVSMEVLGNEAAEGYGGCVIEVEEKRDDFEITITEVPFDRCYFDPHSRRKDFKDAKYMGIVIWMDQEDAEAKFPDRAEEISELFANGVRSYDQTFDDRPNWLDTGRNRIRICQHYYQKKGVWYTAYFTRDQFLIDPKPCQYEDEDGEPICPMELQAANIDRNNYRYGVIRGMIDIQDEINHRRSKALHILSLRQVRAEKGAVDDPQYARKQLALADGWIETNPKMEFEILPTGDMAQAQFEFYADSKNEIDAIGANAALTGKDDRSMSGRALRERKDSGNTELTPLYAGHKSWKKRVYRQVWYRVKQYWTREKWIRVSDDENNLRYVGLNRPMTKGQALEEKLQDEETPPQVKQQIVQLLQTRDPRLNQRHEIRNEVAKLDMDILIDETPDSINIQQDQFEMMMQFAKMRPDEVSFEELIEISALPKKDKILERRKQRAQARNKQLEIQEKGTMLEMAATQADIQKTQVEAQMIKQEAIGQNLENELAVMGNAAAG